MKKSRMTAIAMALGTALLFGTGAASAESATADGQVMKVDSATSKVTLKHGPIKGLDMPDPMSMVYRVKDPAMLKAIKPGDKVKFDLDHETSGYVVTRIEKK